MNERIVRYGREGQNLAILTLPPEGPKKKGVLLANVGLTHHIGPFRQFVDLARALALEGVVSVRFDLSGFGDSPTGTTSVEEDFKSVMDKVKTITGVEEFIVIGNCLGADHAHLAALSDSRITGGVFIDGYLVKTIVGRIRYYQKRLFSLEFWKDVLGRRVFGTRIEVKPSGQKFYVRDLWTQERMQNELKQLANRGFDFCFVYTGQIQKWFNHPSDIKRYFPNVDFKNRLWIKIFKNAGHTFFGVRDRAFFIESIRSWVLERT